MSFLSAEQSPVRCCPGSVRSKSDCFGARVGAILGFLLQFVQFPRWTGFARFCTSSSNWNLFALWWPPFTGGDFLAPIDIKNAYLQETSAFSMPCYRGHALSSCSDALRFDLRSSSVYQGLGPSPSLAETTKDCYEWLPAFKIPLIPAGQCFPYWTCSAFWPQALIMSRWFWTWILLVLMLQLYSSCHWRIRVSTTCTLLSASAPETL